MPTEHDDPSPNYDRGLFRVELSDEAYTALRKHLNEAGLTSEYTPLGRAVYALANAEYVLYE